MSSLFHVKYHDTHQNDSGATNAGLIRGSYHFARPDVSSGATQANYFLANGGGWSADGITLPGALDIECTYSHFARAYPILNGVRTDNPYGATCYGLSQSAMVAWIKDFSNTYHSKTGRYPVIYTTTDWWKTCTGNASGFQNDNPLWIARYASSIGELPAGYSSVLSLTLVITEMVILISAWLVHV